MTAILLVNRFKQRSSLSFGSLDFSLFLLTALLSAILHCLGLPLLQSNLVVVGHTRIYSGTTAQLYYTFYSDTSVTERQHRLQ